MLIRTEDANSEQLIEEYNWAAGAELADSLGADIINSSLGYYLFDVPEQNYTYSQLNGTTTISAKAANIAFETGMLVVNSAGNEGDNEWKYIITPADALGSLATGAVDSEGNYAAFSSIGPSADGRIKPDVMAMGKSTVVQRLTGEIGTSNGTSFSAPLISGMAACLWQVFPNATAAELRQLIIESGTIYSNPNNMLGYGIPKFSIYTDSVIRPFFNSYSSLNIFPNPTDSTLKVWVPNEFSGKVTEVQILSTLGKLEYSFTITCNGEYINFELPKSLVNGSYILSLRVNEIVKTGMFLKASKNGG
jgi:subtilisin family serine protease